MDKCRIYTVQESCIVPTSNAMSQAPRTLIRYTQTRPFQTPFHITLKDDILVALITKQILRGLPLVIAIISFLLAFSLLRSPGICSFGLSLLGALDLLQPVELLPVQLVELRVDVLDCVLRARYDDVFAVIALVLCPS